jgi:very-short-patch-repair endonuclease
MTEAVRRLKAATSGQHGAVRSDQVHDAGVPDHVFRGWVKSGLLESVGTRTYRSSFAPASRVGDLAAILADLRPKAWVSHRTGAALQGFDGITLGDRFDVTMLRGDLARRPSLRVHTTDSLPASDCALIDGIPIVGPVRTIIDLARSNSPKRLTALIDGALRDRLITEDQLIERIGQLRTQGRYGIPKLLEVIGGSEPSRGGHSWLERRYLELNAAHGLPMPRTQVVVGSANNSPIRVDFRYADGPVVVEVLGYHWHRTRAQLSRDTERLNRMISDGLKPYQFTFDQLACAPDQVMATVRAALSSAFV